MKSEVRRIKKTVWIAFDTSEFETKEQCFEYEERQLSYEGIFDTMIDERKNVTSVDPWGAEKLIYHKLDKLYKLDNHITYKGKTFLLVHRKGGGAGMGQYPPRMEVYMLHNFEEEK